MTHLAPNEAMAMNIERLSIGNHLISCPFSSTLVGTNMSLDFGGSDTQIHCPKWQPPPVQFIPLYWRRQQRLGSLASSCHWATSPKPPWWGPGVSPQPNWEGVPPKLIRFWTNPTGGSTQERATDSGIPRSFLWKYVKIIRSDFGSDFGQGSTCWCLWYPVHSCSVISSITCQEYRSTGNGRVGPLSTLDSMDVWSSQIGQMEHVTCFGAGWCVPVCCSDRRFNRVIHNIHIAIVTYFQCTQAHLAFWIKVFSPISRWQESEILKDRSSSLLWSKAALSSDFWDTNSGVPVWLVKGTSRRNDSEWWLWHVKTGWLMVFILFYCIWLWVQSSRPWPNGIQQFQSVSWCSASHLNHKWSWSTPLAGPEEYNTPSMAWWRLDKRCCSVVDQMIVEHISLTCSGRIYKGHILMISPSSSICTGIIKWTS